MELTLPTLGTGLGDLRFEILDLFHPRGVGHEPTISFNPKSSHPKSKIASQKSKIQNLKSNDF